MVIFKRTDIVLTRLMTTILIILTMSTVDDLYKRRKLYIYYRINFTFIPIHYVIKRTLVPYLLKFKA